jgi:hypothetical protein
MNLSKSILVPCAALIVAFGMTMPAQANQCCELTVGCISSQTINQQACESSKYADDTGGGPFFDNQYCDTGTGDCADKGADVNICFVEPGYQHIASTVCTEILGQPDVPTVSHWGALAMVLLVLAASTIVIHRRRRAVA